MSNEEAEEYKKKGNDCFKERKYDEAIKQYNKAITLDPECAAYYSNRSACWTNKGNHDSALADANRCIQKDSNFVKGYARKGKACFDMGDHAEAESAYKEGLSKEPGNDACKRGLEDVASARKGKKFGGKSAATGSGGGIVEQIIHKIKSGGRMQMYMIVMVGYFLFSQLTGKKLPARSTVFQGEDGGDSAPDPLVDGDETPQAVVGADVSRRFTAIDKQWLSYMQADSNSKTTLLLLHRTSLSAEAEFGTAFPQLAKVVASSARLTAPDRPCHGFSPCPTNGEPKDIAWLNKLTRAQGTPERMIVVAAGREAAAQALSLAGKRKEVVHIMLLSPKVVAPARATMTKAEELHAWLKKNNYPAAGQGAADAIRWAASGVSDKKSEPAALNVDKLLQDCKISIIYDTSDQEDNDLQKSLEAQGTEVKTRSASVDGSTLFDLLAEEVQQALNPHMTGGSEPELEL